MRRIAAVRIGEALLFGAAFVLTGGCGGERHLPAEPSHRIAVSDSLLRAGHADTLRLGRMHAGETVRRAVSLRNEGGRAMLVARVGSSCGCATLHYEARPFVPGGWLPAELEFDSRGTYGWQFKRVEVWFEGCDRPLRLYVEAEVE